MGLLLEVDNVWPLAGLFDSHVLDVAQALVVLLAEISVQLLNVLDVVLPLILVEQVRADHDGTGGVEDVHGGVCELWSNLDCGVHARGSRAADEEGLLEASLLHFLGNVDHLVEGRGDQAAESDDVRFALLGSIEDLVQRTHDSDVHDLEVVAREDNAHDVLSNVVHVALDGGQQDGSGASACVSRGLLLFLHEGDEVRYSLLHHTRRLDDLGQEHLSSSEQIADC
mmetsp:Transcript_12667/g.22986  ORF Transcript_12667/g.22986 Transcript_12667/m.22986 type:complete len:226 (-) Transcript_12667:2230-2907(-)